MKATTVYSLYGMRITSEVPLHAPESDAGPVDLCVRRSAPRPVPAEPPAGGLLCQINLGGWGAAHARTEAGFTLRYFNTAEFQFNRDLTEVTACTDPAAPTDIVPELLVANVPAFKRLLSGHVVLHASAVARNGKALGILAQSGGGKSTLAAALCRRGFALVTDDVLTFDWRGKRPWVRPGSGEVRLRPGSASEGVSAEAGTRPTSDGRSAVRLSPGPPQPAELHCLVTPEFDSGSSGARVTQLGSDQALAAVLGHLRIAGWKDHAVLQRIFPEQVQLAREVPAFHLRLSKGPQALHDAAAQLQQLLP